MYYTHILQSLKDKKTYVGYTQNIDKRLRMHNSGYVVATKYRRPFKILFFEKYLTIKEAKKRELYWKGGGSRRRLKKYFEKHGL